MAELQLARADGPQGFEKLVALKLVLPHLEEESQFIAMFLDEARLAARLDHPNVAHVLALEELGGRHAIVMEYVHGRDLRAVLTAAARRDGLPLACALSILRDACAGLHHAHELRGADGRPLGLVHRDVSPQNFVIRYDGVTKLVDFGVAKASTHAAVTRTGVLKGKLGYMSPEQCLGRPIDRRSDVFSLGVVAYEATTCLRLFHADNEAAVINRIVEGRFDRPCDVVPDYPPALEAVVLRALQCDPADRFATAQEMLHALDDVIATLGLRANAEVVADEMTALFGEVPYPSHEIETAPGVDTGVDARSSSRPARSHTRVVVLTLSLGAVLSVAGYALGSASERDRDELPTPPPADTPSPPIVAPTPIPVVEPAPAPTAAPASVSPEIEPPPVPSRTRKRTGAPRSTKPAPTRPGKPAPGDSADSMMPRK